MWVMHKVGDTMLKLHLVTRSKASLALEDGLQMTHEAARGVPKYELYLECVMQRGFKAVETQRMCIVKHKEGRILISYHVQ